MRSRHDSGMRLDHFYRRVQKTILQHQDPVSGLLPATADDTHAWVRDNVYSILAVWGLSMAYKKKADLDEDRSKTYELEMSCVKLMRALLTSMMMQKDKVEKFKWSQMPIDSLHAKYSARTGLPVVGDADWGHLQVDATSLYLLTLAQMTASGLQICYNLDEVCLVQNLVFYIESAYCIPDYGVWERGDKTNHGLPELNASSIGLAKAALEAMNELDLFGARGGPASVIHVLADEAHKCGAVLQSMLPRESNSKEVDSSLLAVISFPAFAVDDPALIKKTRETILSKLHGRHGCKRFLRDGYKTPKEDPNRLYYEPWELKVFETLECEWPLFLCYLVLDGYFYGDKEAVKTYSEQLDGLLVSSSDERQLVPELYCVPEHLVEQEYAKPGSVDRVVGGRLPFMWAQSLYIVGCLLKENYLACGELDPLNRRLGSDKKPDVVVQVVLLAEDVDMQERLAAADIHVQTVAEVAPVEVQPASLLSRLYAHLGRNHKLGLSGRQSLDVGILTTSKLYALQDRVFAFTPQFSDTRRFFIASDLLLLLDIFKTELNFLQSTWRNMLGRPTVTLLLDHNCLEEGAVPPAMVSTVKKLKSGYINGTRVALGNMNDFLNTSCITSLNFLHDTENGQTDCLKEDVKAHLDQQMRGSLAWRRSDLVRLSSSPALLLSEENVGRFNKSPAPRRKTSIMLVKGSIRKSRYVFGGGEEEDTPSPLHRRNSCLLTSNPPSSHSTLTTPLPYLTVDGGDPSTIGREVGMGVTADVAGPHDLVRPPRTPHQLSRATSPEDFDVTVRERTATDTQYDNVDMEELLAQFRESDVSLEEQGDILHYLVVTYGPTHPTGSFIGGQPVTVRDLLKDLYERSCHHKNWALVRHTAGMLGKRVEDLAKAVTDLLVRQKQVTVGVPPHGEVTITRPLPSAELRDVINRSCDESTAMLTQELLVYLAMFIRTEPHLFHEMLRLRVGLIIQVMALELARAIYCSKEEALDHLLNLSPFQMKNLLHHIMSGKEFAIGSARSGTYFISSKSTKLSGQKAKPVNIKKSTVGSFLPGHKDFSVEDDSEVHMDRVGQWIRRRRLDGALNRVPKGFYTGIWRVLSKCSGISIEGKVIPQSLTQESTPGELKFALEVETVLNTIPQPEYRQLVVEALMVVSTVVEQQSVAWLGDLVSAQDIVHIANNIFLGDQRTQGGDAAVCCAGEGKRLPDGRLLCDGAAYVCAHFYDSAPSGVYGTMSYMVRAVVTSLPCFANHEGEIDCTVS